MFVENTIYGCSKFFSNFWRMSVLIYSLYGYFIARVHPWPSRAGQKFDHDFLLSSPIEQTKHFRTSEFNSNNVRCCINTCVIIVSLNLAFYVKLLLTPPSLTLHLAAKPSVVRSAA